MQIINSCTENKLRVLFFGMCMAGVSTNGGALCSRAHLRRLNSDPGLCLKAVVACAPNLVSGNKAYLEEISADYTILEASGDRPAPIRWSDMVFSRWPMPLEYTARHNSHIDELVRIECNKFNPDIIVVEYLPATLLIPSIIKDKNTKVCVITVNREAEMLHDMIGLGLRLDGGRMASRVGWLRCGIFENWIHRMSTGVVAIGRYDLPKGREKKKSAAWISPMLLQSKIRWAGENSKDIFFVGNAAHYPNLLAVKWLTERLAPCLQEIDKDICIKILGCADGDFGLRATANVHLLGVGSEDEKDEYFRKCALFIAPILNTYGSKFKILEAISYGMPVYGTAGALSGVPFLDDFPVLDLDSPRLSAQQIVQYLNDPKSLRERGVAIEERFLAFETKQTKIWSETLSHFLRLHSVGSGSR